VSIGGLLRVALVRAIDRLELEEDPAVLQLVMDLVNVFEQFEARIPFDAQSAFWRIWRNATPERQAELTELHERLGFARELQSSGGAAG
jgi:hypothetical protein